MTEAPSSTPPPAPAKRVLPELTVAQFEQLLAPDESLLISFVMQEEGGELLYVGDNAPALLGQDLAAFTAIFQKNCPLFAKADEGLRLHNNLRKAAALGEVCHQRLHYQHPLKGQRWLDLRALQAEPGGAVWHALIFDVTDQNQERESAQQLHASLERRVTERTNELVAKTRQLEAFTYSVSHDLKAPLRGIDGYSRLLAAQCHNQLGDDGRFFVDSILVAAAQMGQLIEDLLTYSRLERSQVLAGTIDLHALVAKLLDERGELPPGTHFQLQLGCPQTWGEIQALKMAMRNLLDNALKFSARQAQRHITIGSAELSGCCRIWVQDNGPGFDMRYHDRIFEIFQRLHRLEDYPGTGIGLAIVRKAMERLGGRAWAQSAPGEGACFFLEMPLEPRVSETC